MHECLVETLQTLQTTLQTLHLNYVHMSLLIYCILRGQIKGYNSSITTIMCRVGSYRRLGSYRMLA